MSADPIRPVPSAAPAAAAPLADHDALPPGTRFGEFEIIRVLGVGGFGIVYLAQDHSLERQVALKEYMPASLAARGEGPAITVRSGSFAETYAIGLRSFINEARMLALLGGQRDRLHGHALPARHHAARCAARDGACA